MRLTKYKFFLVIPLLIFNFIACGATNLPAQHLNSKYINWLEKQSLLANSNQLAKEVSGSSTQWQHAYAIPQSKQIVARASVWFSAYPSAMITKKDQDILEFLGDHRLWNAFAKIGIEALHTGPLKFAGGIRGYQYTPTVDGWFDRIKLQIDPKFGTEAEYKKMVKMANKHHALIAGDIVPGHTGKGADFLLAEKYYKDYPGIYVMVPIKQQDWNLLPKVTDPWQSVNLAPHQVDALTKLGYIPGHLQRVLFTVPGSKRVFTGWDATAPIVGTDGKIRRLVYLHYFKPGQPTMNWLDPSFAAERIVAGDIIKSVNHLGDNILRIDANPFLGIEHKPNTLNAWSEGHPLSTGASNYLAWLTRKLGGWSFQELNLTFETIRDFSKYGPDLSYDFITRPAVEHAMLTGDASFLRLTMHLEQRYAIKPGKLIHDMQNHDEITYELVHFAQHPKQLFNYEGQELSGADLRNLIVNQMHKLAIGAKTPYNRLSGNGLCTTFVGLIAARMGITDIYHLSAEQKQQIKQAHLLLAMFNAMQPGVFSLSGWDLVGALPVPTKDMKKLLADGDYRWINRGAYDLMNYDPGAKTSKSGIPKAVTLYGPISKQLRNPNSFVSLLRHMLKIRKQYQIAEAAQIAVPKVKNKGVVIMVQQLPNDLDNNLSNNPSYEITAINFGNQAASEQVDLRDISAIKAIGAGANLAGHEVKELLTNKADSAISSDNVVNIELKPLQGKVLLIEG